MTSWPQTQGERLRLLGIWTLKVADREKQLSHKSELLVLFQIPFHFSLWSDRAKSICSSLRSGQFVHLFIHNSSDLCK